MDVSNVASNKTPFKSMVLPKLMSSIVTKTAIVYHINSTCIDKNNFSGVGKNLGVCVPTQ